MRLRNIRRYTTILRGTSPLQGLTMLEKFFANLIFCLIMAGGIILFPTWADIAFAIFMMYAKQYLDEQ
jgi:hypothetical protein